ncbi:MAG: IS30 family transposase [Acidimicrobiales bacterium]
MSEREEICAGIERGDTDGVIASRLGRHRTTINAEINRNGGRARYRATAAERRAVKERARPKLTTFELDPLLASHVEARLEVKDSPMTIARELASGVHGVSASVSHEGIYQAIYAHGKRGLRAGLHEGLHHRRRCRKRRQPRGVEPTKVSPLGQFNLIEARPAITDARTEVGHLEGDLILGAWNRSAIATVSTAPAGICGWRISPTATARMPPSPRWSRPSNASPSSRAAPAPGTKAERWPAIAISPSSAASTSTSPNPTAPGSEPPTTTATACSATTPPRAPT